MAASLESTCLDDWMQKKGKQRQADRPGESCGQTDGGSYRHIQEKPEMNTTYRQILSLLISLFSTMSSLRVLALTPTTLSLVLLCHTRSFYLVCVLLRHDLMLPHHAFMIIRSHAAQVNLKRLVNVQHPQPSPRVGAVFWD